MKKVMVFAPHMDDELIGCGGSLLKHKNNGCEIHIVYFTDGSYFLDDTKLKKEYVNTRICEVKSVCDKLEAFYTVLNIPDRELIYNSEILKSVMNEIQTIQPDIIYLPHGEENDREHKLVNEIVNQAIWLSYMTYNIEHKKKANSAAIVLEYEVWTPMRNVDYLSDITDVAESKKQLICLYASQLEHVQYQTASLSLNRYRGIMHLNEDKYAEAFHINKFSNKLLTEIIEGVE